MTVPAMQMAERKSSPHLSSRVAMRRQSLEAGKEVLDPVALLVELAVVAGRVSAPTPGRDARGNPLVFEGFTEPVGV